MPSSVIAALHYDGNDRRLTVTFVSGRRYDYLGVPTEIYRGLLSASSKGRYFNEKIRDRYQCRELRRAG